MDRELLTINISNVSAGRSHSIIHTKIEAGGVEAPSSGQCLMWPPSKTILLDDSLKERKVKFHHFFKIMCVKIQY